MSSVNVNRAGCAYAVAHKRRPFNANALLSDFDELCDRIGMQKAHISRLYLPRLVLSSARKLGEIDG
jgi:hypothetical protein